MVLAALAFEIEFWIDRLLTLLAIVLALWAFIDCVTRRTDAFPAIGTLPKVGWLAILGVGGLLVLLFGGVSFIGIIAFAAALIYLLDVRRAVRDATQGPW